MSKKIRVLHNMLNEDKIVPIKVTYSSAKENENVTIFSCKIIEKEIPEWIGPDKFEIRVIYSPSDFGQPGVTITDFGNTSLKTVDMGILLSETADTIRVNEITHAARDL